MNHSWRLLMLFELRKYHLLLSTRLTTQFTTEFSD